MKLDQNTCGSGLRKNTNVLEGKYYFFHLNPIQKEKYSLTNPKLGGDARQWRTRHYSYMMLAHFDGLCSRMGAWTQKRFNHCEGLLFPNIYKSYQFTLCK